MSRAGTEVLGLFLGITGVILLVSAALTDCWRRDSKDRFSSVDLSSRCRGLWGECIHDNMAGMWTCDVTLSYLEHLSAEILAMRAVLVLICVVSVVSILTMISGLRCTKLINDSSNQKDRLILASGALILCGGVCGVAGLLWYCVETFNRYRQELSYGIPGITYELGLSYWLAVGGVACALTSGTILLMVRHLSQRSNVTRRHLHVASQGSQSGLGLTHSHTQLQPTLNDRTYI